VIQNINNETVYFLFIYNTLSFTINLPGFRSVYLRYVEDKTATIVLTNFDGADAYGIAFGVADLLHVDK